MRIRMALQRADRMCTGTVPMHLRLDPMLPAARAITALRAACDHHSRPLLWRFRPRLVLCGPPPLADPPFPSIIPQWLWNPMYHLWTRWHVACSMIVAETKWSRRFPPRRFAVSTAGRVDAWPGASNVIPSHVNITIDVRAESDTVRDRIEADFTARVAAGCDGMHCRIVRTHTAAAVRCASRLVDKLSAAAASVRASEPGLGAAPEAGGVPRLASGAGHDAMAMAEVTEVGMLFVRCKGGVSHSPKEEVAPEDAAHATRIVLAYLMAATGSRQE
jgi:acetylornithine deacetylase/succinyl-diaminopimelate desuccinylase-like protein